jgi:hypothetical protein
MPDFDYFGEGISHRQSQISRYHDEYYRRNKALKRYFRGHDPEEWTPSEVPRCCNVFIPDLGTPNSGPSIGKLYEETTIVLNSAIKLLRDSIQKRQIQSNAVTAFAQLLGQCQFIIDYSFYDMVSFLITTERSILSEIKSVFFGRYWVKEWLNNQKFAETWHPEDDVIDRKRISRLVTSLLTSNLNCLG